MCPNCNFCGEYFDTDCFELKKCYKVGKAIICIGCIITFKNVLDITEAETRLKYLEKDINKLKLNLSAK